MKPRLLTRTHYQIDELAYLRVLVLECSSPTKSDYAENLAKRLKLRLSGVANVNEAAARYAADLAKSLGLLTENNFWSDLGHLIPLCFSHNESPASFPTNALELTSLERFLFFRLLLEFDGAALIFFAKLLQATKRLPTKEADWNVIASNLMTFAYKAYFDSTTSIQERSRLHQVLKRRQAHPYVGKSGPHQTFVHLQGLFRIGLVARDSDEQNRCYYLSESAVDRPPLLRFLDLVPDIKTLERVVAERRWPAIASQLFLGAVAARPREVDHAEGDALLGDIYKTYRRVMATGTPLCALRTLIEAVQIRQLAQGSDPWTYDAVLNFLKRIHIDRPRLIHFHVDRLGRPAFLTFASDLR